MSKTRTMPRSRLAILLAVAVAAALTGCAQPAAGHTASSSGEPLTLNVGQISDSVAFFPIFVAENQGFFADEGLTLGTERPRLGTGAKLAAALQSGSIDVGGGVMTDAFNLYKANSSARIIGSLVNSYYVDIVVGSDFDGPGDSASLATRVKALKGKTIGITGPGSGTEAFIDYLLLQQRLDPKNDVTLVNLGADNSAAIGALKTHKVDALSFFQPIGQQAKATHVGRIYISPTRGDVPSLKGAMHGIVFTTQNVLDKKSKAVAAFLRGIERAEKLIRSNSATATKLLKAYQKGLEPATVKALIPIMQSEIPSSPAPTKKGFTESAAFHRQTGLIPKTPGYSAIVPSGWIAKSLKR